MMTVHAGYDFQLKLSGEDARSKTAGWYMSGICVHFCCLVKCLLGDVKRSDDTVNGLRCACSAVLLNISLW